MGTEFPALEALLGWLFFSDQSTVVLIRTWVDAAHSHGVIAEYVADHFCKEAAIQIIMNWVDHYF